MKKYTLRILFAIALTLASVSMSGFAVVSAAPAHHRGATPDLPECSGTRLQWYNGPSGWWSDTKDANNYNQKLTVTIMQARDNIDNVYCNEMYAKAVLRYRNVSQAGDIDIAIIDDLHTNHVEYGHATQYSNPSQTFFSIPASTQQYPLVAACAHAFGQWNNPSISTSVRVPTNGYWCAP